MIRPDGELDEYGKQVLASLRSIPPIDPQVAAAEKSKYLLQGENLRQDLIPGSGENYTQRDHHRLNALRGKQPSPLFIALGATILVLVFLIGSSFTVYAAQSSLPGQPLYTIKSWSEDIRLSMTFSTKAKLNLTLDYTNRRVDEISRLVASGKAIKDQTSERFQSELDSALQLAVQLNDPQMQNALGQIKGRAESQGMTIEELITKLPPQAEPAIIHLQERLDEQIKLITIGEKDPKSFRTEIHERLHPRKGPKDLPTSDESQSAPADSSSTPMPEEEDNGHSGQGNGHGQSTPGNGNHGPKPTDTQTP
jgi:hypothetical protein